MIKECPKWETIYVSYKKKGVEVSNKRVKDPSVNNLKEGGPRTGGRSTGGERIVCRT
jgi:hypothetical protein